MIFSSTPARWIGRSTRSTTRSWPIHEQFSDHVNSHERIAAIDDQVLFKAKVQRWRGGEAVARIRELHGTDGGDLLVMGSSTLVRTLLHEGFVDELRLMIMPVILGGGKTIFPDDGALRTLKLVSSVTSGTGVHVCTYRPVDEG